MTLKGLQVYLSPCHGSDQLQTDNSLDIHSATFGVRHVTATEVYHEIQCSLEPIQFRILEFQCTLVYIGIPM